MYNVSEKDMKTPFGDPEVKMAVSRVSTVPQGPDSNIRSYLRSVTG